MNGERPVTALDLMVGDRVADNFTEWAEVVTIDETPAGVRIEWRLADGRSEATTYDRDHRFTLIESYPDPWGPGGKFIESGLRPVKDKPVAD